LASPLADQVGQIGHGVCAGNSIMDVAIDTDAQLLGCGGQGHKGIPSFGSIGSARSKADSALAHPLTSAEFGGVIVQRDFGMVEHHQQTSLLQPGLLTVG
jgi:hypothetical protein